MLWSFVTSSLTTKLNMKPKTQSIEQKTEVYLAKRACDGLNVASATVRCKATNCLNDGAMSRDWCGSDDFSTSCCEASTRNYNNSYSQFRNLTFKCSKWKGFCYGQCLDDLFNVMVRFVKMCGDLVNNCKLFRVFVMVGLLLLCCGKTCALPNFGSVTADGVTRNTNAIQEATVSATAETTKFTEQQHPPPPTPTIYQPVDFPVSSVDFERVQTPFIIGIWILSASVAKIGFHKTPKLNKIFPESCLLIFLGGLIGVILLFGTRLDVSPLTPNTFFFYMLPPIILDAGYFMPNRMFFDNLGTILLMAIVGTIFNTACIGASLWGCGLLGVFGVETPILDIFLFSSLISAVDPVAVLAVFEEIHVNEILYIVVFGESLLNDAVTVVLYHMSEKYSEIGVENLNVTHVAKGVTQFFVVALGGTLIGVIWGFLTGLVTRYTDNVRVIEPIFIFVMAYLAYLNAEIFHMSGILAITFCGITMKNYVEANISQKSHTTIKYALKMIASSSETVIFMFLGVATINSHHDWNTWFVILTILFCSVFRAIGVLILTAMANKFRINKLSNVDQFVMSYGGLRGAVAFALVLLIDKDHVKLQPMFVTTTIAVIYFTVFVQGITIKPLVKILNVKRAEKKKPSMNERIHERFIDHLMAGIEDIVGKTGNYNVRDKFKRFDNKFIRPFLIRDLLGAEPKILETYSKLTMKDAMDYMRRNPSTIGQMSGTESMSALFRNYTGALSGSPSFSNLENCSRNLDMQELDYNPSKKDLTDAKIHHLLAEELKPYRRHRRLSYSRHAVDDRDLATQQVNYKMHMNIRRMNDRKHHKRSKRGSSKESSKNHVSFPEMKQNGSASAKQLSQGTITPYSYRNIIRKHSHSLNKYRRLELDYINEVLNEAHEDEAKAAAGNQIDDWDDGLTFTAKYSPDSDRANNNSLIAHISSLPGFDASKARFVKQYSTKSSPEKSALEILPTAAELMLPWRRDRSYQSLVGEKSDNVPIPGTEENVNKRLSRDSESENTRVMTPTAIESQLPWKRDDEDDDNGGALKQNEFPAWASNKEYLAYNSPSATFLGGLSKPRPVKSVIGLFRRESSGSGSYDATSAGSDPTLAGQLSVELGTPNFRAPTARPDRRSASICGVAPIAETETETDPTGALLLDSTPSHMGPFAVTASHRRNNRRGSLLEVTGLIETGRRASHK
ncbi:sodium/hydrogen exchanger 3 isoform X15 [Bradysia coprophila]|uniref:sodium/hydrogen exchanger 3 isoform X15 n=1 Tax=Bradysia coprophila TaxID=38358 RepID=UPI00187D80E5|nr:sodium/hydrogen exchanger 3 isoform X15 [Bradysia coprophila]